MTDAVLLPLCLGISLLGVIGVAVAWHHRKSGRVIQAAGVVVVPFALYLTGLLGLVVQGAARLAHWAIRLVFSPTVWTGLSLLGIAVVLWVVGGVVASRQRGHSRTAKKAATGGKPGSVPIGGTTGAEQVGRQVGSGHSTGQPPADDDFADIEALLKKHGIE